MKKNIILIITILFLLSLVVHYYPIHKKGYSFNPLGGNLILARNFAETGEFKIESEKNIVLSSERIKDEGIYCNWGNRLTPYIYGYIFKIFGFSHNLPVYLTLILWSLSGIILFLIVLKLFNLKIAVIFGLLDVFIPVFTQGSLMAGFYEWAVLFFSLGLLLYLYREKIGLMNLFLAGTFFGLASVSRDAFLLSFIPIAVYQFWQSKSFKKTFVFVLPFVLIWIIYLVPGYMAGLPNTNISSDDNSFSQYGHLFPDPYTYHYEQDEYIQSLAGTSDYGYTEYLVKYDVPVSLKSQVLMYLHSIKFYPQEFLRIIVLGGPLIILLLIAGIFYLNKEKKYLLKLFAVWAGLWYFFLIVLKSNNWDHFLEIRFPLILLISLGVVWLIDLIPKGKHRNIGIFVLALFMVFHFSLANKWMLHDEYNGSKIEIITELADKINEEGLNKKSDIIAVNIHSTLQTLNYYTNQNIIYFDIETVNRLLDEHKLNEAFNEFGVSRVIGFDSDVSEEIVGQTDAEVIE